MYLRHFALTRFPFHDALHADELFACAAITETEARLHHLLELKGIGLLTGEVGSGKTTVCRKVSAALHSGLHRLLYVTLSTGNVMDMYKSIAWELGLPAERNRAGASRAIREEITRLVTEAKQQPVLLIDEAHHLRNDVLEELRLLTNYQMDAENRLCLLLVGLTELRRRLTMAVHESLDQRIVVRHHLPGLGRDELPGYLQHRLRLAGTELTVFTPPATEALYQATNSVPRKVNRSPTMRSPPPPWITHSRSPMSTSFARLRSCGHERSRPPTARGVTGKPRRRSRRRAARVLLRGSPRARRPLPRPTPPSLPSPRCTPVHAVGRRPAVLAQHWLR